MTTNSLIFLGSFDPEFNRNKQLIQLAQKTGYATAIKNYALWNTDKVTEVESNSLNSLFRIAFAVGKILFLLTRTVTRPSQRPFAIVVPHPSQIDAVFIGIVARVFRIPMVIDFFISLHETVVEDRKLIGDSTLKAKILKRVDRIAAKLATVILVDTPIDADKFSQETGTPLEKWKVVYVGADPSIYYPRPSIDVAPKTVLFYGTYIPLQGIETIVRAATELPDDFKVTLIGNGQLRSSIELLINEMNAHINLVNQLPEEELPLHIAQSQICLGVFGTGNKTQRVIPNKVFQCLAIGRPVITCSSPAINILGDAVFAVPPGDSERLSQAIKFLSENHDYRETLAIRGREKFQELFNESSIAEQFREALESLK